MLRRPEVVIRWTTRQDSSRRETEDRLVLVEQPSGVLIIVLDGAGGMGGGGRAADLAGEALAAATKTPDPSGMVSILRGVDLLVAADRDAGETTAVVAGVYGGVLVGASAGDSSLWLLTGDDHEELTLNQHRKRRIGSGRAEPVGFFQELPEACHLLAGTDGLFDYAHPNDVVAAAGTVDLETAADQLVDLVRLPSGGFQDDVALVLFDRS